MLDVVLKNGRVVDGSGTPWYKGEVGIKDDRIVAVSAAIEVEAAKTVDVKGQVIAPGFIDSHSHDDLYLLENPGGEVKLRQGVTTEVVGNCGLAPVPVNPERLEALRAYVGPVLGETDLNWNWKTYAEFLSRYAAKGVAVNVAFLAAHGPVRIAVMGFAERAASTVERERMKDLIRQAMEAGALGMSTGLLYAPGCYADLDELVELARVVGEKGGVYVSHIRGEGASLMDSVREALEIGRRAGLPVHISHLKAAGRSNWGKISGVLELLQQSRAAGVDVTCDVYPYTAGSTMLSTLLPPWILEGGVGEMVRRLRESSTRLQVKEELTRPGEGWDNIAHDTGWENIVISSVASEENKRLEGKSIAEVAAERGTTAEDVVLDLLCAENGQVLMVIFLMSDDEVRQVIQSDLSVLGSDGLPSKKGKPHPRFYGSFPRLFAKFVREERALSLERAVQKVTAFPATRFGLEGRGYLKPGMYADITVFDPEQIQDTATYLEPRRYPQGISHVFVNGQHVLENGELRPKLSGRVLRRAR